MAQKILGQLDPAEAEDATFAPGFLRMDLAAPRTAEQRDQLLRLLVQAARFLL